MPHLRLQADPTVVKPCLQCGAALDFDPRLVTARRGRLLRNHATCRHCGALHCLLVEGGMYGMVAAGTA